MASFLLFQLTKYHLPGFVVFVVNDNFTEAVGEKTV